MIDVFLPLRPEMYSYTTDDRCIEKKPKGTGKCVI